MDRPTWDWTGARIPVYRLRLHLGGCMRRTALIVVVAIGLAACSSNEPTSPADISQITDFVIGANGTALTSAGGYDADLFQLRLLNGLPDDLKLTAEQQAKIKALVDAFHVATK